MEERRMADLHELLERMRDLQAQYGQSVEEYRAILSDALLRAEAAREDAAAKGDADGVESALERIRLYRGVLRDIGGLS
jgi:hypothetical protein